MTRWNLLEKTETNLTRWNLLEKTETNLTRWNLLEKTDPNFARFTSSGFSGAEEKVKTKTGILFFVINSRTWSKINQSIKLFLNYQKIAQYITPLFKIISSILSFITRRNRHRKICLLRSIFFFIFSRKGCYQYQKYVSVDRRQSNHFSRLNIRQCLPLHYKGSV